MDLKKGIKVGKNTILKKIKKILKKVLTKLGNVCYII